MAARKGINAAATKDALLSLLAHENTRVFLGKLAGGEDLRRATAELAGAAITTKVAQVLGASAGVKTAKDVNERTSGGGGAGARPRAPSARPDPSVIDAEFVEINVTEQAKKATGKK